MSDLYSINDVIRNTLDNVLMGVHTSIPARVEAYDSQTQLATLKPVVNRPTHTGDNIPAGVYFDVPVVFPSASNWVIAGPIAVGDILLMLVPHYGIEEFMTGDRTDIGDSKWVKHHDINEAIAIPGMFTLNSVTRKEEHQNKFHLANGDNSVILIDEDAVTAKVGNATIKVSNGEIKSTVDTIDMTINGTSITGTAGVGSFSVSNTAFAAALGANGVTVDASGITVNGPMTFTGNINSTGVITQTGALNVTGAVTATGAVQGSVVTDGTVTLGTHTHPYTDTPVGAAVTGPGAG